ncbi:hypothetical protein B0H14DRAFT_474822 [Mycena olivaceomarginata]|nr:hypothetical protein B0H14DRAFT_474822 [Mycena olivaceomarginata]
MQSSCSHYECILRSPFALPPLPSEHRTRNTYLVGYLTWSAKARTLVSPTFLTLPWFFRAPAMSTFLPDAFVQYYRDSFGATCPSKMFLRLILCLSSGTYFYFVEYPRDKIWLKTFVSVLWLFNTLHSALIIHMVYHYLILNAFDIFALSRPIMTYFLSVIFQYSKPKLRWWLTVPNGIVVLVYTGFGIETVVDLFKTPSVLSLTAYTKIAFLPLAATQAGADSMMAISLCFVLFNHRTGFRRSAGIQAL